MFGTKKRKLVEMIGVFSESWTKAQMTDAMLAGAPPPPALTPHYYALLYGATDSFAQSMGLDLSFSLLALRTYFEQFTDGQQILDKVLSTSNSPELLCWSNEGGQAVHAIVIKKDDPIQVLLPLAEKYRLANG